MSTQGIRGLQEFARAGRHSRARLSDFTPNVLGVQEGQGLSAPDDGDGNFAFRTPSSRQLQFTAPTFHAGQFTTLNHAIDFHAERRRSANPNVPTANLDPLLLHVPEMDGGLAGLIEDFLGALNDDTFDQSEPATVPSGLPPGGFNPD